MRLKNVVAISALCLLSASSVFAEQKAVYEKYDGDNVGARVTFPYKDDSLFKVNTRPGFVTDIQLRQGEELTYVAGGDTKTWLIDKAKVNGTQHVYLKPLFPGKHTNIIVNTDQHTYRLDVWSGEGEYDPLVTFEFADVRPASYQEVNTPMDVLEGLDLSRMNKNYEIKAKKKEKFSELIPDSVMDDGFRTYIKIPETNRYDMPVLYMINPWDGKKTLVNYRVLKGYFVADVVMAHGQLFYHQKYAIDFFNKEKESWDGKSSSPKVERKKTVKPRVQKKEPVVSTVPKSVRQKEVVIPRKPEPVKVKVRDVNPVEEMPYRQPETVIVRPQEQPRKMPVQPAPSLQNADEGETMILFPDGHKEVVNGLFGDTRKSGPVASSYKEEKPVTAVQSVPQGKKAVQPVPQAKKAVVAVPKKTAVRPVPEVKPVPVKTETVFMAVRLPDGKWVRMPESEYRQLPLKLRLKLAAENSVQRIKGV